MNLACPLIAAVEQGLGLRGEVTRLTFGYPYGSEELDTRIWRDAHGELVIPSVRDGHLLLSRPWGAGPYSAAVELADPDCFEKVREFLGVA